jgi:hypothetical protein
MKPDPFMAPQRLPPTIPDYFGPMRLPSGESWLPLESDKARIPWNPYLLPHDMPKGMWLCRPKGLGIYFGYEFGRDAPVSTDDPRIGPYTFPPPIPPKEEPRNHPVR